MTKTHRPATEAEAKALASAVRLRILRLCLDEALTNKEIAARLGANPATVLHHVRILVSTGFLAAQGERRGTRGAREIPYRATGKSWFMAVTDPGARAARNRAMIDAFLQEIQLVEQPGSIHLTRMPLRVGPQELAEFLRRVDELLEEYKQREPDPDGEPVSIFFAAHPDVGRRS
ncbi:MAG TPA: helix-turn-helix domain-containing protein [Candidatus Limnocylindrales bacterium]